MSEIERKFIELYGEFNLTAKDPAYRVFKSGWDSSKNLLRLDEEEIDSLIKRVTIEASLDMLYVTELGMKVFARQIEQLLNEKNK